MGWIASRTLLTSRAPPGTRRSWGLHGEEAEQDQEVVGDHVPQGTGLVVVAAAVLDADGLGHGDLDVVDVVAAP
jgi:hypothetical protein